MIRGQSQKIFKDFLLIIVNTGEELVYNWD